MYEPIYFGAVLALLEVKDLVKNYHKGNIHIPALQGVSFSAHEGEFISIVGRSGSGKSTLLNLIGGLDTASSGKIRVDEKNLTHLKRGELAHYRKKTVGMIFQSFNLISYRTALENITLALAFGGIPRNRRKKIAEDLLSSVGLSHRCTHRPSELSGGEAQRVAIARAFANQPKILLADEPTGNLDSTTSNEIINLLKQLNIEHGVTVLMVTHEEEQAQVVSDHIIKLLDGKIIDWVGEKGNP